MKEPIPDGPLPVSQLLASILRDFPSDRLPLSQLAELLRYRSWGGLLVIFAGINILPLPPGASIFTGLPLLIISAQMVLGRASPWFPKVLNRRGVKKEEMLRLATRLRSLELRVERIFKPRLAHLSGRRAARIIGATCFFLSLIVVLPLPLVHNAPAAAIALFGLALLYRDGALVIVAAAASLLSLVVTALVIGSSWMVFGKIVAHLGG